MDDSKLLEVVRNAFNAEGRICLNDFNEFTVRRLRKSKHFFVHWGLLLINAVQAAVLNGKVI
jgi:hypothetical protein